MSGSSVPLLPLVSSLALLLAPGARGADEAAPRVVRDAVTDRYVPAPLSGQEIDGLLGSRLRVNLEKRLLEGVDVDVILTTLMDTGRVRDVANHKAYEMTSNLVGLLELDRVTGDDTYLHPVLRAWSDVVRNRLYVSGTTSWGEMFREDHVLRADGRVGEGCVTTTWMQLNLQLLRLTGEARFAEEIERTVYNALLAAQHPQSGLVCYFVPLVGEKEYGAVEHGVPGVNCCTSSIPRGLDLVPDAAWGSRGDGIAVNLYVPGHARVAAGGQDVTLASDTRYPEEGAVSLSMKMAKPARFPLSLRVPAWSRSFVAKAGGNSYPGTPGTYLEIDRTWSDGDSVEVQFDLTTEVLAGGPTYPDLVGVRRGPQVLAADERVNHGHDAWMDDLWMAGLAGAGPRVADGRREAAQGVARHPGLGRRRLRGQRRPALGDLMVMAAVIDDLWSPVFPDAEQSRLLKLKTAHPALHNLGRRQALPVLSPDRHYAFAKVASDGAERLLVVLNFRAVSPWRVRVPAYGYRFLRLNDGRGAA